MSASSVSTTASSSFSRYVCATSAISSGIATGSPSFAPSGLVYAHMWSTSTIPVSSCSDPIGRCTATHLDDSWPCSWSSVRKKSARSRSSMLTTTTRDSPRSSARFQTRAGADLHAHHRGDDDERTLDDAQRAPPLALEGRVARAVDEVDLAALPGGVSERERDRELALVLVLVPVGDGRARLDRAEPVHLAGLEEQRFDERRLARPAMTDDGDVADLPWLGCSHLRALLLSVGAPGNASPGRPASVECCEVTAEPGRGQRRWATCVRRVDAGPRGARGPASTSPSARRAPASSVRERVSARMTMSMAVHRGRRATPDARMLAPPPPGAPMRIPRRDRARSDRRRRRRVRASVRARRRRSAASASPSRQREIAQSAQVVRQTACGRSDASVLLQYVATPPRLARRRSSPRTSERRCRESSSR